MLTRFAAIAVFPVLQVNSGAYRVVVMNREIEGEFETVNQPSQIKRNAEKLMNVNMSDAGVAHRFAQGLEMFVHIKRYPIALSSYYPGEPHLLFIRRAL